MKFLWVIIFILASCEKSNQHLLKVEECVVAPDLAVWQLIRVDGDKHLFTRYPAEEGSKVEMMEDISTLKKIKCPEMN